MELLRSYIDPGARAERLLLGVFVFWICDGQLAAENQMCSQATVSMGQVVGVPVI